MIEQQSLPFRSDISDVADAVGYLLSHESRFVTGQELYVNGGKLSLVAWHTPQAVYWISNTLNDLIGNRQMIAIAASLRPA